MVHRRRGLHLEPERHILGGGQGTTVQSSGNPKLDVEIIGLVRDAKYSEVKGVIPPLFFRPYLQDDGLGSANFYVRTAGDPVSLLPAIAAAMNAINHALSEIGVADFEMPATPFRVWQAINQRRPAHA